MSENWLAEEVKSESKKLARKSGKLKIVLGLITVFICVVGGTALSSMKPGRDTAAAPTGLPSVISSAAATPAVLGASAAAYAASLKFSKDQAAYQQALANGDKALAASLLNQAESSQQYLIQQEQQYRAANTPIPAIPIYTPAPTPVAITCAYPGKLGPAVQSLIRAENQLSADQDASHSSMAGLSGAQIEAYWAPIIQTDQNNVTSAQNAVSFYESQPGC